MSATAVELSWPTDADIEAVLAAIGEAHEKVELLNNLRLRPLVGEDLPAGAPTLEDIGRIYMYATALDLDAWALRREEEMLRRLLSAMDSARRGNPGEVIV
jgi:hypothetical protein